MLRLLLFLGLLRVVPLLGDIPNWVPATEWYIASASETDKLDAFLVCTGFTKPDTTNKETTMNLALLYIDGKPGIQMFVYGKKHIIDSFEFGKEFRDTLLTGKEAKTIITVRKSSSDDKKLLMNIFQMLDDGVVITHKWEINPGVGVEGKSKCKNIEIFTRWNVIS